MRAVEMKTALLAWVCALVATPSWAGLSIRTASDTNGRVVVEIDNSDNPTSSSETTFFVAVAPTGSYSITFVSGPASASATPLAPRSVLSDTLTVSAPISYRGARVVWIRVQVPANIPLSHVVVDYEPATTFNDATAADPLLKRLVMNMQVFPLEPRSGSPDPWFSLAATWVKMSITERGVYSVTGADLTAIGVNLAGVDPATIRLYTRGGLNETRAFADTSASWLPGKAMREVPIQVEAGGDGTFDPGDRIVFYGIGARDWSDYFDASAADTTFQEHTHTATNHYYLAWDAGLPGAAARISDLDATPAAVPDATTYRHREYRERDLAADFDYGGDGWLWLDIKAPSNSLYGLASVDVRNLVTSRPQEFWTVALAPYASINDTTAQNEGHHAVYLDFRGGQQIVAGEKVWDAAIGQRYYEDGVPVRVTGGFLLNGVNQFRLRVPGDLNAKDKMRFAWFAVAYHRRLIAVDDAIGFSSSDTTATVNFRLDGFGASGTVSAFDVTDVWNPRRLTGVEVTPAGAGRRVRLASTMAGSRRHFWVAATPGLKRPAMVHASPVDLRAEASGPNMLIVCHRDFRAAADRLRSYRATHLPLYASPAVKVVTTDDIYDNFSGGMPDPMALRNYFKFLYDNYADAAGNPALGYVLLLGDANQDFNNHVSPQPDFVPSNLYFTRYTIFSFSTDEWFAHLDAQDVLPGEAVPDLALGRLPAASAAEAALLVDKTIGYENEAPRSSWRNRYILVADDESSSFKGACEKQWTFESEAISLQRAPGFPETEKIYLTEYPNNAGVKPQSRAAFLDAWNQGALVINYIGHGSSQQMADEQVFLNADVSQLNNGLRLPLMMAFSCTIGDFANPAGKSLSEKLLLRETGGAIGTVTASTESYPNPNELLNFALFERLLPRRLGGSWTPVGVALAHSKLTAQAQTGFSAFLEENSWKYNLLADPALTIGVAQLEARFETAPADTMIAGIRRTLRGAVYAGGVVDATFDGPVEVVVREPALHRDFTVPCGEHFVYLIAGGAMYRGTTDAVHGEFEVSFRVPRDAATGTLGMATAYAHDGNRDAAVTIDSVLVVVPPTLEDSLALRPVDGAPRVDLGFKSGLTVVKPGDTVRGVVRDQDGINILETTNAGKQAILIDHVPVPIDMNEFFTFDHGGVDTSGVLLYPLPELPVGHHRLVYKVSDCFGATTVDTLYFDVTDAANYYAEAVLNYPNPFRTSTQFLLRLSNRASIRMDLFTVSGKRVRTLEQVRDAGEVWIEWDGRDGAGGDLANGTYLYVATVKFDGLDRAPVVLRGGVSKIR
jgi:Peptidase family C25/FlgD Ig-like domain